MAFTRIIVVPRNQQAVILEGPGKLTLTSDKDVLRPGPTQILARVEAVGLSLSDIALFRQFSAHPQKGEIVNGISREILQEIPNYAPGDKPTVPGHEVVFQIVAVGMNVHRFSMGERCLVQTEYRHLKTAASCAAFGFNFEGGLQEYVLLDERVLIDAADERCLLPVGSGPSASAVAAIEPWACVESSYANIERRKIKAGGKLLAVVDNGHIISGLVEAIAVTQKQPPAITVLCEDPAQRVALRPLRVPFADVTELAAVPNNTFDDIIYFGSSKERIEALTDKLAPHGILNIVTGEQKIGRPVSLAIGRIHNDMIRIAGTTGKNAMQSYQTIPNSGELRTGDKMVVIGAGGPMGRMHVTRALCSGVMQLSVTATDIDTVRLAYLQVKMDLLTRGKRVVTRCVNVQQEPLSDKFSHFAVMVPDGQVIADAVRNSLDRGIINIFASLPAEAHQDIDLDAYIANHCYLAGSPAPTQRDLRIVLDKVERSVIDSNSMVEAVSGLGGVAEAFAAIENRTILGKVIVYPGLREMGLVPLTQLDKVYPTVAAKLERDGWCKQAEEELLKVAAPKLHR